MMTRDETHRFYIEVLPKWAKVLDSLGINVDDLEDIVLERHESIFFPLKPTDNYLYECSLVLQDTLRRKYPEATDLIFDIWTPVMENYHKGE